MKALVKIGSAAAVSGALLAGSVSPTFAFPTEARLGAAPAHVGVTDVAWSGGRYGWRGGYGRRGYGWGRFGYGAAGFLAGAAIGSALARPAYVYAPVVVPARGGGAVAFCEAHYRSYSPRTGTYVGYDGLEHPCP